MKYRDFDSEIMDSRNSGDIPKAIQLCNDAIDKYPENDFYPMIKSDLFYTQGDYGASSTSYIEFLSKISRHRESFGYLAKRYNRLRRVLSGRKREDLAGNILRKVHQGNLDELTKRRYIDLIKTDLRKSDKISPAGEKLTQLLRDDSNFHEIIKKIKTIEIANLLELYLILDQYVLNRKRSSTTFRIDAHCISVYEKYDKYENALKIAEELLEIRLDSIVVRSIFRICRGIDDYERADKALSQFPGILKISDFNVLYELVYYFEEQDNLEQVQLIIGKMEKFFPESISIQKTVKNFYLRFGMIEDVNRVKEIISDIYSSRRKKKTDKYLAELQESESMAESKMEELQSKVKHQERLEAVCDLTCGISHELGQPITNIRYTIQFYRKLFKKKISREHLFKVFDSILEETERMGALIDRLSPLTSRKNINENFDLTDRIRKRVEAENVRMRKNRIQFMISPKSPIYLFGDPAKFDQVVSNLLLNSIDAIKGAKKRNGNWIRIIIKEKTDHVEIIFSDSGTGITVKKRGKIFEPFFSTKAPGKGEGLGLFIVWNIMKSLNGKVLLDREYKNGASFILTIPKNTM